MPYNSVCETRFNYSCAPFHVEFHRVHTLYYYIVYTYTYDIIGNTYLYLLSIGKCIQDDVLRVLGAFCYHPTFFSPIKPRRGLSSDKPTVPTLRYNIIISMTAQIYFDKHLSRKYAFISICRPTPNRHQCKWGLQYRYTCNRPFH